MRQHTSLFPAAAASALAFTMAAIIFIAPGFALAAESKSNKTQSSSKPHATTAPKPNPATETQSQPKTGENTCGCPQQKEKLWSRPKFAEMPPVSQPVMLDESDEIAALESVQFALSEVGDGASYIWHRNNGHLSGMVQPVTSFKDGQGQICRHVIVLLTSGINSKKTEGVACRLTTGQWKLEG